MTTPEARDAQPRRPGRVVFGIVAQGRIAVGVVAMGGVSIGVVALGGIAIGVVAIGGVTFGVLALGGVALGGWAVGAVALGVLGAQGALHLLLACPAVGAAASRLRISVRSRPAERASNTEGG